MAIYFGLVRESWIASVALLPRNDNLGLDCHENSLRSFSRNDDSLPFKTNPRINPSIADYFA